MLRDFTARLIPQVDALTGRVPPGSQASLQRLHALLGHVDASTTSALTGCQTCGDAGATARAGLPGAAPGVQGAGSSPIVSHGVSAVADTSTAAAPTAPPVVTVTAGAPGAPAVAGVPVGPVAPGGPGVTGLVGIAVGVGGVGVGLPSSSVSLPLPGVTLGTGGLHVGGGLGVRLPSSTVSHPLTGATSVGGTPVVGKHLHPHRLRPLTTARVEPPRHDAPRSSLRICGQKKTVRRCISSE